MEGTFPARFFDAYHGPLRDDANPGSLRPSPQICSTRAARPKDALVTIARAD